MFKSFFRKIAYRVLKIISPLIKNDNMHQGVSDIIENIIRTRFNTYCKVSMTKFVNESLTKVKCQIAYPDGKYFTFNIEYVNGEIELTFDETTIIYLKEISDMINSILDGVVAYDSEIKGFFQLELSKASK